MRTPIYTHCKPEKSVLAVKIRPFRWVKYSSIFGSILALNRGKYSPITYGWFGPKGWNKSQPGWNRLLMGHGSWRGWIRLWPAGLNWHFGAKTDLFNFQCTTWKWVGSVIPENQRTSFVTEWNYWYGSKLRKKNISFKTNRLLRNDWGERAEDMNKTDKKCQETHQIKLLLDWLISYLHEKHILLAKTSYHSLRSIF